MNINSNVLGELDLKKIKDLNNKKIEKIVEEYLNLCQPDKATVITDSPEDIKYVRELALKNKEEQTLAMEGHTIHYDGYFDQARDKDNTKILVTSDMKMSKIINTIDKEEGLKEVLETMKGAMKGKEALIRFFCLGPLNSEFSIPALQITDSAYVAHSEDILYRTGYEQFKKLNGSEDFFYLVHSAGELDEKGNSKNLDKRRIYIDVADQRVFTVNNQYAGNSLGLKKLALRLAIYKADQEGWLTEHMFIMGAKQPEKDRLTYFAGAFPSACGKTSTAMISGQKIVGDDIAYLKKKNNQAYAVNVEQGIFGIIENVNPEDDPIIYETLTSPRELIFSNVLIKNDKPYWLGMGQELPKNGYNHSGDWEKGNKDAKGNLIDPAHKNARYTLRINELANADDNLNNPEGVPLQGIIYGGRDSDTSVPVYQSFGWEHGVYIGATLESETTAATLGQAGVRKLSPMANLDFLVIQLGKYIKNHLDFGDSLKEKPLVFSTNYFLKDENNFLNDKLDKKVWLLWMEGRVHNEFEAIKTPIGYIPLYQDLKNLFKKVLNKDYSQENYKKQFTIRIGKFLEKIERMEKNYQAEKDIPKKFYETLNFLKKNLTEAQEKFGADNISPDKFVL